MAPDPLASQVDRYHRALGQQENGSPSGHLAQCIPTQEPLLWSVSQSRLYDPLSYGRQNNAFAKLEQHFAETMRLLISLRRRMASKCSIE